MQTDTNTAPGTSTSGEKFSSDAGALLRDLLSGGIVTKIHDSGPGYIMEVKNAGKTFLVEGGESPLSLRFSEDTGQQEERECPVPGTTAAKTQEEIRALKLGWIKDPCWDIADTEGFEAYKAELEVFNRAWTERSVKMRSLKKALGPVAAEIRTIEDRLAELKPVHDLLAEAVKTAAAERESLL